jgi:molybdate transport system substrate-binding protein
MCRLLLVLVVLGGCGGGSTHTQPVVSAASSLQGAFTQLGGARFSFAGSDDLAAQIRQGVTPDVFASANTRLPDALYTAGLVHKPRVFAGNRLVLAVPARGGNVRRLADLYTHGVTLAIGSPSVPVGAYTREVIGKLAHPARVLADVRSQEPDAKGVVGKLIQGAVDAGFVYGTDVRAAKGQLKAIALPPAVSPTVSYAVAVVKGARHPDAARAFVASLLGGRGRAALRAAGFSVP